MSAKIAEVIRQRKNKGNGNGRVEEAALTSVELLVGNKQPGESSRAVVACNDFLRMGAGRKVSTLLRQYKGNKLAPATSPHTVYEWSTKFGWEERANIYDAQYEDQKTERSVEVMSSGLALTHNRVEKLKGLADQLESDLQDAAKIWLADVKQIGGGRMAERVDLIRFNWSLIEQYRNVLDDLAKETGGRVNRNELTSDTGDYKITVEYVDSDPAAEAQANDDT